MKEETFGSILLQSDGQEARWNLCPAMSVSVCQPPATSLRLGEHSHTHDRVRENSSHSNHLCTRSWLGLCVKDTDHDYGVHCVAWIVCTFG